MSDTQDIEDKNNAPQGKGQQKSPNQDTKPLVDRRDFGDTPPMDSGQVSTQHSHPSTVQGGGQSEQSKTEESDTSSYENYTSTPPIPNAPPPMTDTTTKVGGKTLHDIEQDIAKGDFDLSDIHAFGDHNTPEVDDIHINQDAQSVLNKIQNQNTRPPFTKDNADPFQQGGQNQNRQHGMDNAYLNFDFNIEKLQAEQSKVKWSVLKIVFNFTIFVGVVMAILGVVYYVYTQKVQIHTNAPVILKAHTNIKTRPCTRTGIEIPNLDNNLGVYKLIDPNETSEEKEQHPCPIPESPLSEPSLPLPTLANTAQMNDHISINDTVKSDSVAPFVKGEKTVPRQSAQVEKIILHPPTKSNITTKNIVQNVNKQKQAMQVKKNTAPQKKSPSTAKSVKKPLTPPPQGVSDFTLTISDAKDKQDLGWRVQVASLINISDAKKTYINIQKKHSFLQNMPFHVEKAKVKGTIYYRLQVMHIKNKANATALCKQIKDARGDCIVKK